MKFKFTVIGLLTAIFITCIYTSYVLIEKTNKQLDLQKLHMEIEIEQYRLDHNALYYLEDIGTEAARRATFWEDKIDEILNN